MLQWYQTALVDTGRSAALWMLIGFIVTFAVTRAITVHIRARSLKRDDRGGAIKDIYIGGVHIHHQVVGILLLLVVGLLEFRFHPGSPGRDVLAVFFGVGSALALDEFALWLHLDDVYWTEEGRKSIDAVMVALVVCLAVLAGSSPLGLNTSGAADRNLWIVSVGVLFHLSYTVVCLLKGKLATGIIGLPVPFAALVGAVRLANPTSFWAHRFYGPNRMARAQARFGPERQRRLDRLRHRLGGV